MNFLKRLVRQFLPTESVPTDERRASVRLNVRIDISIAVNDKVLPATVVNLTFTGLCLELKSALKMDQELTLQRDDFGPPFKGTVLWLKKGDGDNHLVGVECELDEERLINSWLEPALVQAGFEAEYVDERRQLIRVPGRVTCKLIDPSGKIYDDAVMHDLSTGGALLVWKGEIAAGLSVGFKTLPLGDLPALQGSARVLTSQQTEEGVWQHGLSFTDCSEQEIQAYMESMLNSTE